MGKVYIMGTGPGDEQLLTVKAVRVLKSCTAVLYDRLVSNNILNYLDEKCEIYYCGKEPGAHYKTQEEINKMLVKLAKKGHTVARIKGGDPYVFGRGGEEVLELKKENISFEVIPGITSPIAVLNYAGIPITHRKVAQSFHIVTGMSSSNLKVNFESLSKEEGTLVFMMGLSNLEMIVENLIINGKNPLTPCAVIMRGTCSKQKKVVGVLENIVCEVKNAELKSPCIIVVGEVVNLNNDLNWYENKPLFGLNVCITRAKEQSLNLKEKLQDMGAEVTNISAIKIEDTSYNLDEYVLDLENYHHVVFTSVNSVNIFFDYLIRKEYDIRNLRGKIYSIGKATTNALKIRGIIPHAVAKEFVSSDLINILKESSSEGEKIMIPCSSISKNDIAVELEKCGRTVERVFIYDTVPGIVRNKRAFEEVDIIFFTSPSTVSNMVKMVGIDEISKKTIIAIGPKTNDRLEEFGINATVCREHSEEGFLNEIQKLSWRN